MGLAEMALAKAKGENPFAVTDAVSRKPRRMADRMFDFIATYPDGTTKTWRIGQNSIQRYRQWFRINHPEVKTSVIETQTSVTSDGKTYTKLAFTPKHWDEAKSLGKALVYNEPEPKDAQLAINWPTFMDTPPSVYTPRERLSYSERRVRDNNRAKYLARMSKNVHVQDDDLVRIYLNETGRLIYAGSIEGATNLIRNNGYTAAMITLYLPASIHSMFMKMVGEE